MEGRNHPFTHHTSSSPRLPGLDPGEHRGHDKGYEIHLTRFISPTTPASSRTCGIRRVPAVRDVDCTIVTIDQTGVRYVVYITHMQQGHLSMYHGHWEQARVHRPHTTPPPKDERPQDIPPDTLQDDRAMTVLCTQS